MKKFLVALLLGGFLHIANAVNTFDNQTNVLTLDSVVVGNTQYNNVSVLLDFYVVVSVGSSALVGVVDNCTQMTFKSEQYNLIKLGMNLDQINKIMGCKNDPNSTYRNTEALTYVWIDKYGHTLYVFFDPNGFVTKDLGGGIFKSASGF